MVGSIDNSIMSVIFKYLDLSDFKREVNKQKFQVNIVKNNPKKKRTNEWAL